MDRIGSLNLKPSVRTDDQSQFSELSFFHTIALVGGGLLNLVAVPFDISVPSVLLVWGVVAGIIYMALISIAMRSRKKPINSEHIMTFLLYFFLLFMWRLLQTSWSVDQIETIHATIKTFILTIFVLSAYYSLHRMPVNTLYRLAFFIIATLLSATFLVYLMILQQNGGISMYGSRYIKNNLTFFGGSNAAGAVVLLLGLWNWTFVCMDKSRYRKTGICFALLTLFLLVGIASYSSLAGYVASFIVIVIFSLRQRWLRLFILVLIGMVCLAAVIIFFSYATLPSADRNDMLRTTYQRTRIIEAASEQLKNGAWIYGVGAGAFMETVSGNDSIRGGVHNALLQSLIEGGIVELSLYIGLYIWLLNISLKRRTNEARVLVAVLTGFFIRNLAESGPLLYGLINNFTIFVSWYVVIYLIVLMDWKETNNGSVDTL